MINELLINYIFWLKRYSQQEKTQEIKQLADKLLQQLQIVTTVLEMQQVLVTFSETDSSLPGSKLSKQIETWKEYLKKSRTLEEKVSQSFLTLNFAENIQPLRKLILQILEREDFLFHGRAQSLLVYLSEADLEETLAYLAILPSATSAASSASALGTFKKSSSLNLEHAVCVQLLEKNSLHFDEKNIHQTLANNLLQTALIIYLDMHKEPELKIEHSKCILF